MLIGAHGIIPSARPEEDRAFLRDVLGLPHVDVGQGWLVFGLPPSEVSIHPVEDAADADRHELYLMCASVEDFVESMHASGVRCGAIQEMDWGRLVQILLPGGGKLGVYEPLHARPESMKPSGARRSKAASKAAKRSKPARKAAGTKAGKTARKASAGKAGRATTGKTRATKKKGATKRATKKKGATKRATKKKGAAKKKGRAATRRR